MLVSLFLKNTRYSDKTDRPTGRDKRCDKQQSHIFKKNSIQFFRLTNACLVGFFLTIFFVNCLIVSVTDSFSPCMSMNIFFKTFMCIVNLHANKLFCSLSPLHSACFGHFQLFCFFCFCYSFIIVIQYIVLTVKYLKLPQKNWFTR